jgi:3-hydroxybutyryl-CoA dehydratase
MDFKKNELKDLLEGMIFSFEKVITKNGVDSFVELSGDISPVHVNDEFARDCGFKGCVVHGALLVSYLSQLRGIHLPGENCFLLESIN